MPLYETVSKPTVEEEDENEGPYRRIRRGASQAVATSGGRVTGAECGPRGAAGDVTAEADVSIGN